jgi:hypothetical protein
VDKSMFATDLAITFLMLSVLFSMIAGLVLAVKKYSKKVTKIPDHIPIDMVYNKQLLEDLLDRPSEYLPSCPPMASLPPPPPYTALDNHQTTHPPSYSLLIPRS